MRIYFLAKKYFDCVFDGVVIAAISADGTDVVKLMLLLGNVDDGDVR